MTWSSRKRCLRRGDHLVVEEPFELMGNPRQSDDDASRVLHQKGGGGAVGVVDRHGSLGDVGLTLVVGRQDQAPAAEPGVDLLHEIRVPDQRPSRHPGDHFPGQVVPGGTQTSSGDHDVGPIQGPPDDLLHPARVVPHHRLVVEIDSQPGSVGRPSRPSWYRRSVPGATQNRWRRSPHWAWDLLRRHLPVSGAHCPGSKPGTRRGWDT